jgi:hypothetical protein
MHCFLRPALSHTLLQHSEQAVLQLCMLVQQLLQQRHAALWYMAPTAAAAAAVAVDQLAAAASLQWICISWQVHVAQLLANPLTA